MPHLRLIVKEKPSSPLPPPPPPPPPPVRKPDELAAAHSGSPPRGTTLPPYKRLTIEDLLSAPPPSPSPPPPPARPAPVAKTAARFQTPADLDMAADTAALDMLACVCDLVCRDPRCEEAVVLRRQWQPGMMGARGAGETEEEEIIRGFVRKAAGEERPAKRQRVDQKWEEPAGPTFSFPGPRPDRKPKGEGAKAKAGGSGAGRARPRNLRENPKPSRLAVEQ